MKAAATEVKSLKSPPTQVMKTMEKVLILLGHEDLSWKNCVNVANKEAFKFTVYEPKKMSKDQRKRAGQNLDSVDVIKSKSMAASQLLHWVHLALRIHDLS